MTRRSPSSGHDGESRSLPGWLQWVRARMDLLFLVAILGVLSWRFGPQVGAALGLGGHREEITGEGVRTLDGTRISLDELRGRVVLVNFWATWCPPCVLEMPGFQRVYEDYRDRGFTILGVSRDQGSPDLVRIFLRQHGITYPIAMQADTRIQGLGRIETLPTSFLIGKDGTVRHRVTGLYVEPTLRMAVRRLLDE